ncbi:tetratricopeptide repeat domain containing protein [Metarhizium acridum CQMa 102]|uniref:Tetratricopeptide repeat domain containing protein n=1 Tax=Metarhizium acridum (strain CQMa 102) TaxID=655827 RepID=E9E696_METAQ|nr:tetratricopeptide repeat domain containing protein [Metarhizium acridum CQMa 102]EFY88500.1 tetratricopeptide repeat domain containing protein [Metarhizium acridum CQMa 102]
MTADTMKILCPDAGYLNHMPGHIYMLRALYEKAMTASEAAIRADDGPNDFFITGSATRHSPDVTTAMQHYARGVACASMKQTEDTERERQRFQDLQRVPPARRFLNNPGGRCARRGKKQAGRLAGLTQGNYAEAHDHLREAVRRDDNLGYAGP